MNIQSLLSVRFKQAVSCCLAGLALGTSLAVAQPQLETQVTRIGYPGFTHHGVQKSVIISITNPGDSTLEIIQIQGVKSTQTGSDWLSVSTTSLSVMPLATETFDIVLNKAGVFNTPGTIVNLSGLVYLKSNSSPPSDSVNIVIDRFLVADTVVALKWDTISTGCLRLTVSNNGEMGHMGIGRVNMDFVGYGVDCDSAGQSHAEVYLYDGGPVVNREIVPGSVYSWSSQLYQDGFLTDESFKPVVSSGAGKFTGVGFNGYRTGTFVNRDTTIGVQATYYAPTTGDSCNFIIVKKQYFNMKASTVNHVTVGEQIDWDVPSDSVGINTSKILGTKTIYQRGTDTGTVPDCGVQRDSSRYAALFLLGRYTKLEHQADICWNYQDYYGALTFRNDTLFNYDSLSTSVEGKFFWNLMGGAGLSAQSGRIESRGLYTYYHNRNYAVYDTVTVYTALVSLKFGTESILSSEYGKARNWYYYNLRGDCCLYCGACCTSNSIDGRTGNVDMDPGKGVDIGDLSALIDFLYISFTPPPCMNSANIDGDAGQVVDIADLAALIDYLYISFTPPANCM